MSNLLKSVEALNAMATIRRWREHPADFVREVFGVEPDPWQAEELEAFPHHQRQAFSACKGPGKSALLAWLGWNFLCTRPQAKCAATSITGDTLQDTLWAEMAKWRQKSPMLLAKFEWQRSRIYAREAPETWWMSARTWSKSASPEEQANTLAGLHADYILFLLDEAGGMPDSVMAAAEAALASCVEGHLVIAGNPTHVSGPLYRACTTEKKLWRVRYITGDPDDPMRSPRISVQWAREQIEKYGADSPWVLVNVFGKFPPGSLNALITVEEVEAAEQRVYTEWDIRHAAKLLGVDVARFGDDKSVMFPRQGRQAFTPEIWRNLDSTTGGNRVKAKWDAWDADGCFVDNSGGFGSGWIDRLRLLGKSPIPVDYSGKATDERYFNKRAEMYMTAAEWIREGGALPKIPELKAALTKTQYMFKGKRLILQPKDQVKDLLGYSPDEADAFVQTFHSPVSARARGLEGNRPRHQTEYNPFSVLDAAR